MVKPNHEFLSLMLHFDNEVLDVDNMPLLSYEDSSSVYIKSEATLHLNITYIYWLLHQMEDYSTNSSL
ncbi:hypothetical protein QVD17_23866 [Tagetes erecta]|uniref:Uncharacterized protein n=1 Tax=Tagetes erecta TaxID=13708 RepID=A0AAD8KEW9_TARER|nr:hypothetical protein QVD17_23866 [Tagetes erecta]